MGVEEGMMRMGQLTIISKPMFPCVSEGARLRKGADQHE